MRKYRIIELSTVVSKNLSPNTDPLVDLESYSHTLSLSLKKEEKKEIKGQAKALDISTFHVMAYCFQKQKYQASFPATNIFLEAKEV